MRTPLYEIEELVQATGGQVRGTPLPVEGLSIDTRTLSAGDAFFAITGDSSDGHAYVARAFAQGAALAVVARDRLDTASFAGPLLVVDDVLAALERIAAAARARSSAGIVAVTGSVGKTTTKDALRTALAADGPVHASPASYNNHWGVPLSLARLPRTARYGVFEIGMNHPGEITPLTRLVRPQVAIVTTVEPVHLAQFRSVAEIAVAKAEIFAGLEPGGSAVLNLDNPHFALLEAAARVQGVRDIITFGADPAAHCRLIDLALKPDCSVMVADVMGSPVTLKVGMPGRHVALNMLAVLAAARRLGADLACCALALAGLRAPPGRGVPMDLLLPGGSATLRDESYNANPASMRAAIDVLSRAPVGPRGRRIAVLGDMLELGPEGPAYHRALAEPLAIAGIDLVFCCGALMQELWHALPAERRGGYAEGSDALTPLVAAALRQGDTLMVKGSNASRMGLLVEALTARLRPPALP